MNRTSVYTLGLIVLGVLYFAFMQSADKADAIYTNGAFWTGEPAQPYVSAIAVKDGRIIAMGENKDIIPFTDDTTKAYNLEGRRVLPGFIDNHTHFEWVSSGLSNVKLRDAKTPDAFSARIASFAKGLKAGRWIMNGDWDHELWGGELPRASWINPHTPDNPVFVTRLDGHMGLANAAAMKAAGIDASTPDVAGGEIVRNADGTPTGIFKDAAMELIFKAVPTPSIVERAESFKNGINHALSHGVTQIHDMGLWADFETFRYLQKMDDLNIRVYSFLAPHTQWLKMKNFITDNGRGDIWHRWGGIKFMTDGSLGSTTAWFYEPFNDAPHTSGFPLHDMDAFYKQIKAVDASGLQATVHAIGDRANDWALDAFQRIASENPPNPMRRWRIEHAQHQSPDAFQKFAALDVTASAQPYHAIDDGRFAEKRIGAERIKTTYAFKSFLDAGARLSFGSDAPVAPMNVIEGIYAAVTRQTLDGANPDGWVPQEKITVEDALHAYTSANAYAGFQEDDLGTLEVGKLADFVVLSDDILTVAPATIRDIKVDMTIVGGEVKYTRN